MQTTAWTGSITTAAVGCALKSAVTLPVNFPDGALPRRPPHTGYGRKSLLLLTPRPAMNTLPPTRRPRSLATIASLRGTRLSFKRLKDKRVPRKDAMVAKERVRRVGGKVFMAGRGVRSNNDFRP